MKTAPVCIKNCIHNLFVLAMRYINVTRNVLIFEHMYYTAKSGMDCATNILLFISSLLSPGEAGLVFARPAFLFLGFSFLPLIQLAV